MPPAHVFASLLPILVACAMLVATGAAAGAWLARRMSRRGRRPQHRPARPGSRRARREKILAAIAAWKEAGRLLSLEFSVEEARGSLELAGNIQGNRVIVSSFGQRSGKGRVYYTRYRILFPRLLHLGLRLSRERPLGEAPKRPGSETVETGDAAFDGDVAVHSTDPEAVREYLSPERRDRIHRLLKSYPGLVVGDAGISWTAPGLLSEPQEMVTVVRRMTHVAVEMWKTGGDEDGSAAAGGAVPRTEKIPPIPVAKEIPLTSGDPAFAELGAIRDGRELLVTPSAPASAAAPASVSPPAALSRPASGERTRAGSGGQLPAGSILRGSERFSGLSAGAPPIATPASPPPLPAEASIGVVSLASGPASPPPLPAEASIGVVSPAACPPSPPPLGSL
ncbi:MAG: hypothetical protein JXA90_07060, partial [Planctomycetes bacterium]|nr:hypothetical protein [Planctomycetota bacterium]